MMDRFGISIDNLELDQLNGEFSINASYNFIVVKSNKNGIFTYYSIWWKAARRYANPLPNTSEDNIDPESIVFDVVEYDPDNPYDWAYRNN